MKIKKSFMMTFCVFLIITPLISNILPVSADETTPLYIHTNWQNDPKTTVTACWKTTVLTDSIVQYGLNSSYGNEVTGTEGVFHTVEITGLTPDTRYHYRVGNGNEWSGDYSFKTGTAGNHIQFLDVGDSQNQPVEAKMMSDVMSRLPMDMVTFTGDICNTATVYNEWYHWFNSYSSVNKNSVLMPILGNHERNNSLYYDLFALPGKEEYYSFNLGPVHFASLHTLWNGAPNNLPEQAQWLISDLENHQEYNWTIILMHIPPFASSVRYHNGEFDMINETFVPIFEQYEVDVVFTGHEHLYERLEKNNVTYIISGGGGSKLINIFPVYIINESVYIEKTYNFLYVDVYENKLSVGGYRPDYSLIDQFSVNVDKKPDLSFVTLPITYNEDWNESFELEVPIIIKNTGEEDIIITTQGEYKTDEGTFPFDIPPLAVNEEYSFSIDLSIPTNGSFDVTIDLDITQLVDEVVEENNDLIIIYNALEEPEPTPTDKTGCCSILAVLSSIAVVAVVTMSRKKK